MAHSCKAFLPSMQQSFSGAPIEAFPALFRVVFKAIADFANSVDECRDVRVGFDLAAQRGDATIHAARGDHDGVAPDGVYNTVPSERPSGMLEKVFEETELLVRERHFDTVLKQAVRHGIEAAATEHVGCRYARLSPAQKRLGPRHEFTHAERLGNII